MPEQYRDRRGDGPPLSKAHDDGDLIRVYCSVCRLTRVYLPSDLIKVAGDIPPRRLERQMRCQKCKSKDYLTATNWRPTAQERVGLRIRRLVEIRTVRKVIWRDEDG